MSREECPDCSGQGYHEIRQFGRHVEDEYLCVPCRWCDATGTALTWKLVAS